ncbi:glycosyltransferase family 2 protein [Litoribacter populi]|uniref:glycosyltransferase family 2 protein n=1 Tax=Litoribacter populi TaxID=2598460 RepID=UPI00117FA152|nr:glycosyltransferase family 2 protein [Litoribacter populi]
MQIKKPQPLVSIAVCTYNGGKYLTRQLDTLVNQTYPNLEIVVLDDGSTDTTWGILKEYESNYTFFTAIQNPENLGYVKNFEKALGICNGDYIALSDQDDLWALDKIEKQMAAIGDHLLVYHDSHFIDEKDEDLEKGMTDIINLYHGSDPEPFLLFNCVSGHSMLIKRELLDYALPFQKGYFHDHWLAYVAANVGSIGYIDERLVHYRQHTESNTDILNLRKKNRNKRYHSNRDINKLQKELSWLKMCASYPNNRDSKLVKKLTKMFENRMSSFISIDYAMYLFKNRDRFLCIPKKSAASKNTFIYKQIWGLKTKLFWDKLTQKQFLPELRSFLHL